MLRCPSRLKVNSKGKIATLSGFHNHQLSVENVCKHPSLCYGTLAIWNRKNFTDFVLFIAGKDVTYEDEFIMNNKGFVSILLNSYKFIKTSNKQTIARYRCSLYKSKCNARLVVDKKTPLVKFLQSHNHQPPSMLEGNPYLGVVSVQKFKSGSTIGSSKLENVEINPENLPWKMLF